MRAVEVVQAGECDRHRITSWIINSCLFAVLGYEFLHYKSHNSVALYMHINVNSVLHVLVMFSVCIFMQPLTGFSSATGSTNMEH